MTLYQSYTNVTSQRLLPNLLNFLIKQSNDFKHIIYYPDPLHPADVERMRDGLWIIQNFDEIENLGEGSADVDNT